MGELTRFGVSLDRDLLEPFDNLCARRCYASRSEALRDMIRAELDQDALNDENVEAAGVLSIVYDHHVPDLSRKLTERQHSMPDLIVASLHVHLDHNNCLETLVLRGRAGDIKALADQLRAIRGVHQGSFTMTAVTPHSQPHTHRDDENHGPACEKNAGCRHKHRDPHHKEL